MMQAPKVDVAVGMRPSDKTPPNRALAGLTEFLVDWRSRLKEAPATFADFEKKLRERMMGLERDILAEEMAQADVDTEAVVVDGVTYRRVLRATETYMTAAGPVCVERSLYKDRTDEAGRAIVPMELRLGVIEGFWTPGAAEQASWVVAHMTPQLGEELFVRVGTMDPSKTSLDRLPKALSRRWEDDRKDFEANLRATDVIPVEAKSVALSLDGVLVPVRDGDRAAKRQKTAEEGRLTKGPAGYREVGCGTLSFCDDKGDLISAIRIARMPEPNKLALKRSLVAELTSVLCQRPDLKLVKLADAAADNWTFLLSAELPDAFTAVDFFHATEHLSDAVAAAYGDGTVQARRRYEDLRLVLRDDPNGVSKVIRALDYLHKKFPEKAIIERELKFFRKNRPRMAYQQLYAQGLPIGSGVQEAACKTLATQRMKLSGMRWGQEGGQAILTLRGWTQSERFDRGWALLAATYRAEVQVLANVVPLRRSPTKNPRGAASM